MIFSMLCNISRPNHIIAIVKIAITPLILEFDALPPSQQHTGSHSLRRSFTVSVQVKKLSKL
jgi:hypothetical protein